MLAHDESLYFLVFFYDLSFHIVLAYLLLKSFSGYFTHSCYDGYDSAPLPPDSYFLIVHMEERNWFVNVYFVSIHFQLKFYQS